MTKGHYDASFESEFIPQTTYGGPVQQQNNSMTSGPVTGPIMTSIDSIKQKLIFTRAILASLNKPGFYVNMICFIKQKFICVWKGLVLLSQT